MISENVCVGKTSHGADGDRKHLCYRILRVLVNVSVTLYRINARAF